MAVINNVGRDKSKHFVWNVSDVMNDRLHQCYIYISKIICGEQTYEMEEGVGGMEEIHSMESLMLKQCTGE